MHTMKAEGTRDIPQFIGKHSARWRQLVSVRLRPLYLWRNKPLYRLSWKPGLRRGGGRRQTLLKKGIEPRICVMQPVTQ